MQSPVINEIQSICYSLEGHPLPDYLAVEKKMHGRELKYAAYVAKYKETIGALAENANTLIGGEGLSIESTQHFIKQLNETRFLNHRLKFSSVLPISFLDPLAWHDAVLQQLEMTAFKILAMAENSFAQGVNYGSEDSEIYYQKAVELENSIELTSKKSFIIHIQTLKEVVSLYQQAVNNGKISAIEDLKRVSTNYYLFREFAEKCFKGNFFDSYLFENCFIKCKFPLTYQDPRLQSLLQFCIQMSSCRKEVIVEVLNFVYNFMDLPPDSIVGSLILQKAQMVIFSKKYLQAEEEYDQDALHYGALKMTKLKEMLKKSEERTQFVTIGEVPAQLEVNMQIVKHPRIELVRYAHNSGKPLTERIEWIVDRWMAEFRAECLMSFVCPEDSEDEKFAKICHTFLLKQQVSALNLILQPIEKEFYDYSKVKPRISRLTSKAASKGLYKGVQQMEKKPLTEQSMISFLLSVAHKAPEFSKLLREHLELQQITATDYFQEEDPELLSKAGARAILFAAGYLIAKKK